MDLKTSVQIINSYAQFKGMTVLQALSELDLLCHVDWAHTLTGAPKKYQPKTTPDQQHALDVFCRNRQGWKQEAQTQGVNISDWN